MIPDLIDQFRIQGKVAVVTGASRGIGEGIAIGLADAGAHVIITARDHERLKTVKKNIAERNGNCSIVVGTPTDIAAAVLYLVSYAGSWVTGQNIVVDGGVT